MRCGRRNLFREREKGDHRACFFALLKGGIHSTIAGEKRAAVRGERVQGMRSLAIAKGEKGVGKRRGSGEKGKGGANSCATEALNGGEERRAERGKNGESFPRCSGGGGRKRQISVIEGKALGLWEKHRRRRVSPGRGEKFSKRDVSISKGGGKVEENPDT